MKKTFIALCRCDRVRSIDYRRIAYFTFHGVWAGKKIRRIEVHLNEADNIEAGKDYLMALELIRLLEEHIICALMKYKSL